MRWALSSCCGCPRGSAVLQAVLDLARDAARPLGAEVVHGAAQVVPDAVRTEPGFMTLFAEYNKYLLRRIAVWLDI